MPDRGVGRGAAGYASMVQADEKLLAQMVAALVQDIQPERIYLFGSYAQGRATADSDVDLLVVEDAPFGEGRSRWSELWRIRRALAAFGLPKDILVYSVDEVKRWRGSLNHIIGHCVREGRLLYERR
ncbi:MAG: nucleotidyltransferase domain-containing protein [Planctomycetota bacterium]|nr:nucleotidyltransferase domain-containing protein [Planctomycetota bacterium]